jgi:hypothetical protein
MEEREVRCSPAWGHYRKVSWDVKSCGLLYSQPIATTQPRNLISFLCISESSICTSWQSLRRQAAVARSV